MAIAGTLLLLISCNSTVNVDQILKDDNIRQEVFNKITVDHEMMTDFMEVMMQNNHAKMMMKGNQGMKEMMMDGDDMMNMMNMMKDKPEMMQNMMGEMMKDGKMMGTMMNMMKEKGMMSEECAESCMKMMNAKGMNMDNEGDMNTDDNHESHNH